MKRIEKTLETLLSLRRDFDMQIDVLVQEVLAGESDEEYIERKKATIMRYIDNKFSQLYTDLKLKDE